MSEPGLTVALSGGGIRAATFALGAWNALGERKEQVEQVTGAHGPRLVAVSGGSYLAASIALLRTYVIDGKVATPRGGGPSWSRTYAVGSKEITRLRHHTRDLVEPRSQLLGGLLTLVVGSVANLLVMVGFAWFAAWLLSWLYVTAGILRATNTGDGEATLALDVTPLTGVSFSRESPFVHPVDHWAVTWLVPALAVITAVLVVWVRIFVVMKVDQANPVGRLRRWLAKGLAPAVAVLLLYVVAVVGVPWALFALNQLAVHNAPTRTAASAISALGFADDEFCRAGLRDSVARAYDAADARAALSVGAAQTMTAGACGKELVVSVERASSDEPVHTEPQLEAAIDRVVPLPDDSPGLDLSTSATALLTLVTTPALAVRRANATDPAALAGWRGRLRKLLTSWLPFAALVLVLSWLLLSWTFVSTLRGAALTSPLLPLLLSGAGLLVAVVVDANATAVHSYYRQRLSSAWAVGRTTDGEVDELPAKRAYTFSEVGPVPLHVVTTANVRAYTEAPTRRGGLAMVFSPEGATLVNGSRACWVPMTDYETCAGRGRVSVMAVVATSGAAVSPMAGRYSFNIAPFRLLLTLFNVRVGAWVANPLWGTRPPLLGRPPAWLISRPGAAQVFAEAVGRSSVADRWLYLSDGGHLDNTGLVEAVRLNASGGFVVVVDASNDVVDSWSAVGDAIGVVRADLGIDLRCVHAAAPGPERDGPDTVEPKPGLWRRMAELVVKPPADEPEPRSYLRIYEAEVPGGLIEVLVVKAVRPDGAAEGLPEAVRSFTLRTGEFPRSSTTRQDFGDVEFEAYRALGEYYMRLAWEQWHEHRKAAGRSWPAGSRARS